jgi:hypothetical protein
MEKQQSKMDGVAKKNKDVEDKFLAENSKKTGCCYFTKRLTI